MKRTHVKASREGKEAPSVSFQSAGDEKRIAQLARRWHTPEGRARVRATLREALALFGGTIAAAVTE